MTTCEVWDDLAGNKRKLNLLDKKYMRRDQIWFTSKNEDGESSLYSLADFNVRNFDSFEKDYLSGIYGGIPNLKDYSFVGGINDGEG